MAISLAVSTWSLHKHMGPLHGTEMNAAGEHIFIRRGEFPEDVSLLDFPRFVGEKYGLKQFELCQMHFPRNDKAYLDDLRGRIAEAGAKVANVPIDVGNISNPDAGERAKDIANIKRWMDVAAYIGSPAARVNSGRQPEGQEDIALTIASYKDLVAYAAELGIKLLMENHGGVSADPKNIEAIVDGVGSEHFALCPDFGNFPEEIRYDAIKMMLPHAFVVHAKTFEFDGNGRETRYDLDRCMRMAREAGFKGAYSIEFEGPGDQYDGVAKSVALLRTY